MYKEQGKEWQFIKETEKDQRGNLKIKKEWQYASQERRVLWKK